MRRRTRAALLAAAAATALLLTGCGATGSVSNADGPVIGTSPAAPVPTPDPAAATADATTDTDATAPANEDTAPPAPVAAGTGGACGPDQVQTQVNDFPPSASNRSLSIIFYNVTAADCRLTDPPIVELVGPDGAGVPTTVVSGVLPEGRPGADRIPADFGVFLGISWRVVPATADADPAVDCVSAGAVRVRLTADSPPIDVPVNLTACERGTLLVDPYDINAG